MSKGIFVKAIVYALLFVPLLILVVYKYCPPLNYQKVFSTIYEAEKWGKGMGSGAGSNPDTSISYIAVLQRYLDDPQLKTIVDLGCGDWEIMRDAVIPDDKEYVGYDVVPELIAKNTEKYGKENIKFVHISGLQELAKRRVGGDLLIVKDVLQHLPNFEIKYFLQRILPRFKYALITNEYLEDNEWQNTNIRLGSFRALSLIEGPYNLQNATEVLRYRYLPDAHNSLYGTKQVLLYVNPKQFASY